MERLPKERRLRGRDRIGQLFAEGARGSSGAILVRAVRNDDPGVTRIVAVAGKKLGNAVRRNRMRRRLRAAFRTCGESLPGGWDFALVARRELLEAEWPQVIRDLEKAMRRAVGDIPSGPRPFRPRR